MPIACLKPFLSHFDRLHRPSPRLRVPAAVLFLVLAITPVLRAQEAEADVSQRLEFGGEEGREDDGRLLVVSEKGYLEYDEDSGLIYANQRTSVHYMGLVLEADSLTMDVRQEEITAIGNVVMRGDEVFLEAEKIEYNFRDAQGRAEKARGHYGPIFFRYREGETPDKPTFEQISEQQSVMRGGAVTSCGFTKPHYEIRAKSITIFHKNRVLLRGATLYVRGVPTMYFPLYSRTLDEGSPWMIRGGYKSDLGAWARLGYVYHHLTEVPDPFDDEKMVTRSRAKLELFGDWYSARGVGAGLKADYMFRIGERLHTGEAELYGLNDDDREVDNGTSFQTADASRNAAGDVVEVPGTRRNRRYEDDDEMGRYQALVKHRSELTDDLDWIVNVDWMSDPELYDDVLDLFREQERRRVMERRARTALTYVREQMVARVTLEVKDRIGRDRITNFSDPGDSARDFDEQPELVLEDREDEAIPTSRWGRASVRAPQITLETAWLKLWNTPLYYHTDVNVFNNLDKGLNTVDQDDDAYVRGGDWYQALMWRWRISRRLTLISQVGAGGGAAVRESTDFDYYEQRRFDDLAALGLHNHIPHNSEGGLEWTGPETFLIGDEEYNLSRDVSDGFGYGDAKLRLNARLTDALTGDLIYRYRAATDDSLGAWYANMGARSAQDDLYAFRLREHNVESVLRYALARPDLTLGLRLWRNLVGTGDLYPQELLSQYGVWGQWRNASKNMDVFSAIDFSERQIYHPSDARAFIDSSISWRTSAGYTAPSRDWWTRWGVDFREELDQNVGDSNRDRYTENEARTILTGLVGGRVGPKWKSEVSGEWDTRTSGLSELNLRFERDIHDALLLMMVGFEQDVYDTDGEDDNEDDEGGFMEQMDLRIAIQPKLPSGEALEGVPGLSTLEDAGKSLAVEPGY